jgi:hypothetical protein
MLVGAALAASCSPEPQVHPRISAPTLGTFGRVRVETFDRGGRIEDAPTGAAIAFVLRGAHAMRVRVLDGGIEDIVTLERAPAAEILSYDVDVSHAPGLRLVADTLEVIDEQGTPRLRVAPPFVIDRDGSRHDAHLALDGCAYDRSPVAPWGRAHVAPGAPTCRLSVSWPHDLAYPLAIDPNWTTTAGKMAGPRTAHRSVLLGNGMVLVTGGVAMIGGSFLGTAELFDPKTGTFAATDSMPGGGRVTHTATKLADGRALIAGGYLNNFGTGTQALIYDPVSGSFQTSANLIAGRQQGHTATLLPSGNVLFVGGFSDSDFSGTTAGSCSVPTDCGPNYACAGTICTLDANWPSRSAEVFDPTANGGNGGFTQSNGEKEVDDRGAQGGWEFVRFDHTATLLPSGQVFITGGFDYVNNVEHREFRQSRLYDPASRTFKATAALATPRSAAAAALLPSGQVLIAGGDDFRQPLPFDRLLATAEMFDPSGNAGAGSMTTLPYKMTMTREFPLTALLPLGRVLVFSGATQDPMSGTTPATASAELFDPVAGTFTASGSLAKDRCCTDGVLLGDGRVVMIGGTSQQLGVLADAETYSLHLPGDACKDDLDCSSRVCEAGVCCKSSIACTGTCIGCAKGTGECQPRPALEDDPGTCDGPNTCGANGTCLLKDGQICKQDSECASTFCTDGFCCNQRCGQACAGCAERKREGKCSPIPSDDIPRVSCPTGFQCSGNDLDCVPPTCNGVSRSVSFDGLVTECTPYVCGGNGACLQSCKSVDDCLAPFVCDTSGRCVDANAESVSCALGAERGGWEAALILAAFAAISRRRRR